MTEIILLSVCIVLLAAVLFALVYLIMRKSKGSDNETLRRIEQKVDTVGNLTDYNSRQTENLSRATETRLNNIQTRLADDIKYVVDNNARNLERIRATVDEKLTDSLDGKLSESYARISERLEKMYESVGAMKSLSDNVSDIKRVFTNVKLRGTWGEAQLEALLSDMLAPDQFQKSVKLDPLGNTLADFAVLLPAKDGERIYLPIDSKFPVEEFERLVEASETGNRESVERASKNLDRAVRLQADSIVKKYVLPPVTTDFAIMYLPSEALYAEVMKLAGLSDYLRARRVTVCGPTNFTALLATLQTGFRSAAIEKRSGELKAMLETFRADFMKFAELLEKTRKKLQEATDTVESAEKRTNTIGRRLDSFRTIAPPEE